MSRHPRPGPDTEHSSVITDARSGASRDLATRQRRYTITMAFRTACFVSMIFVPGALRWVLLGAAVVLPYIAVLFANQTSSRPQRPAPDEAADAVPSDLGQLGSHVTISAEPEDEVRASSQGDRAGHPRGSA